MSLTAAAWNMKVGRGRAAIRGLRDLIADSGADVVLLQEAKNYVPAIRVRFPGWRVFGGPGRVDSSNCVVMVRRTRKVTGHGRVRNGQSWAYEHKGRSVRHDGRVWRWVRVEGVALMSVHRATNALGLNAAAGEEEAFRLVDWFEDRGAPALAAGDFNNRATDTRDHGPSDIADRVGGRLVAARPDDIDLAVVLGANVTVARLGRYGSDHNAHRYVITKEKP